MKKQDTTNTFHEGLLMDLNPLLTPNNVVTNCLNGTLVTFSGNENTLQNDMGNGRVETAYLPEGYVPLGTTELGGIIYIVSYNPIIKKCQIGSFPSPERNISTYEYNKAHEVQLNCGNFYEGQKDVIARSIKLELTDKQLHPGDKFCITSPTIKTREEEEKEIILSAYGSDNHNIDDLPRQLKLHVVSIQDDGKIIYLDDKLTWYDNKYYINNKEIFEGQVGLDEYRSLVKANYSVFNSKVAGKLAILAELEAIDTFSVAANIHTQNKGSSKLVNISFASNWTYENRNPESRSLINPIGIRVVDKDTENNKDLELRNIPNNRKNDGTDPEIIVKYNDDKGIEYTEKSKPLRLTLMPIMKYGYLKYLSADIDIDLAKIGSGITNLTEYRYFVEDQLMTLSYGFDSYPQEGKKVNSVTFEFSKFDKTVYEALNKKIDTNFLIKTKESLVWNDGSGNPINEEFFNYIPYKITNTSDSILGHFSERIFFDDTEQNGLNPNSCYLTKITIDYNGEEKRIYYRLLYTSRIFNSVYYEEDDFCNLVLNDYLKYSYNQDNIVTKSESKREIYQEENRISSIPNSNSEEAEKSYKVKDSFTNNITSNIYAESLYSPFKLNIISAELSKTSLIPSNNAVQQYITIGNETLSVTSTPTSQSIGLNIQDGKVLYGQSIVNIVDSPININYGKFENLPVLYQAEPLDGDIYYLSGNGRDKGSNIGLTTSQADPNSGIAKCDLGDDVKMYYTSFDQMEPISSYVREILNKKDWIALCCNIWKMASNGAVMLGSDSNDNVDLVYYDGNGNIEDGAVKACLVFFVLKSDTGIDTIAKPNTVYGVKFTNKVKTGGTPNDRLSFSTIGSLNFDNAIKSQFANYYKLTEYSGLGVGAWLPSNIVYWSNFNAFVNVTNLINFNKTLEIENATIKESEQIKNLQYNKEDTNISISNIVDNRITLDSIISSLLSGSLSTSYIYNTELENFVKCDTQLDKRALYSYEPTTNTFIRANNNIGTKLSLNYDGSSLTLSNKLSNIDKVSIYWKFEEQLQKIKNISLWKK